MRENMWNAALFAGKRECCVLGILVMMFTGILFITPTKAQWAPIPPVAPSDLAVASDGGNALMLIWDDNSDNEDNFIIERKIGTEGTWSVVATLPADTIKWRDDNSANLYNTPYIYQIKAVNTEGESKHTPEEDAVTELAPTSSCQVVIERDLVRLPTNPAPPLPYRFERFRNDLTNLELMRLSDNRSNNSNTLTAYSYWTTFNSNNTRIFVINGSGGGTFYQMDPDRFRILGYDNHLSPTFDLAVEGLTWSKTNPDLVYATRRNDSFLMQYNLATGANPTEVRAGGFTTDDLRGGYLDQMTLSEDNDDVFSWTLKNACAPNSQSPTMCGPNERGSMYFTWKRSTNQIEKGLYIQNVIDEGKSRPVYNETHVSKNGNYLLRALDYPQRRDLFPLGTPTPLSLHYFSHFDLGRNFLVGFDPNAQPQNQFIRINYSSYNNPQEQPTVLFTYKDWKQENHFSLFAENPETGNEDWALVSNYSRPEPLPPGDNENIKREIFMVKTNVSIPGDRAVKRLAHHYSVNYQPGSVCTSEGGSGPLCYYAQPRANISRDGKFVAFTSNWGVFNGRKDVYILKTECPPANQPTATIGGRITRNTGGGMYLVRVKATDSAGNTHLRLTTAGGYYDFGAMPVGNTTVTVSKFGIQFVQSQQTFNLTENRGDINFTEAE